MQLYQLSIINMLVFCLGGQRRIVTGFVPSSIRIMTKASSTSSSSTTSNLRRQRPTRSSDATTEFIDQMKRQKGFYQDFAYGQFMVASSATEARASFTHQFGSLPEVFPLEGKDKNDIPVRMRFAPSPTGSLHVGGARTALYNYLVANKAKLDTADPISQKAAFVLRVEDTDVARSTKESEESVMADLRWLGLTWDEGPDMSPDVAPYGPYRQSERSDVYLAAAQRLIQNGKAYRCFCTPEELDEMKAQQEAAGQVFKYDGRWRDADPKLLNQMLDDKKPFVVRFKVTPGSRVVIDDVVRGTVGWDADATVGDFILLRSSGIPVYNFCVAVDDASMGIATVVRAEEHLTNTLRQALILDALGAPRPRYAHCSLILGEDKQKLSKRHGATSCDQYRLDGFLPDAMINYLALLGWNDGSDNEIFTREELIEAFELERVVKSPSVFDLEKLKWVNGQHMKMMSVKSLIPFVQDQLKWQNMLNDDASDDGIYEFAYAATALAKQMMLTTKDAVLNAKTVLGYNLPKSFNDITDPEAKSMIEQGSFYSLAQKILEQYEQNILPMPSDTNPLATFQDATGEAIEEDDKNGETCLYTHNYLTHMKQLAKDMKLKGKLFFHPLRLMLTGEMSGQDVTKQISLLAIATKENSVINQVHVVPFQGRMQRLREFCETIPTEYREPRTEQDTTLQQQKLKIKSTSVNDNSSSSDQAVNGQAATVSAIPANVDPIDSYEGPPITALDIRVGRILKVWEHEEAEKLYCEEIDVGEDKPRQIASGLRPYLSKSDLENRLVLVLCNLKERKLVGFPSHGMVLCASNEDHTQVRIVNPPVDAKIGERIIIPNVPVSEEGTEPYPENKIAKKKVVESLAPYLKTSQYGIPEFCGRPFMTSAGACTSSIPNGSVS